MYKKNLYGLLLCFVFFFSSQLNAQTELETAENYIDSSEYDDEEYNDDYEEYDDEEYNELEEESNSIFMPVQIKPVQASLYVNGGIDFLIKTKESFEEKATLDTTYTVGVGAFIHFFSYTYISTNIGFTGLSNYINFSGGLFIPQIGLYLGGGVQFIFDLLSPNNDNETFATNDNNDSNIIPFAELHLFVPLYKNKLGGMLGVRYNFGFNNVVNPALDSKKYQGNLDLLMGLIFNF